MKKIINILLIAILSVVFIGLVLFVLNFAKDMWSDSDTKIVDKHQHETSKNKNNKPSDNPSQNNSNEQSTTTSIEEQDNSTTSTNNNENQSIETNTSQQQASTNNQQNSTTNENSETASNVDDMSNKELIDYYTQNMDEDDKKVVEGRFEYQKGNEYSDYIRDQLKSNPDAINATK